MYPVLFRIGSFEITSFGAMVAIGALVGLWIFRRELLRAGLPAPSRFGLVLMLDRRLANVPLIRFKTLQAEKHLL